jgi:CheY-like chemotaxis protein
MVPSLRPRVEKYPTQGYAAESRSRRKEYAMAWRQQTLLCIDNNQSNLNLCKVILEGSGYQILTVSSAREGLEVFASNAIDAVILDYQMPEMNGERVADAMLSDWVLQRESVLQIVDGFVLKGDPVEFLLLAIHQLLSCHKKRKPVRGVTQPREAFSPLKRDRLRGNSASCGQVKHASAFQFSYDIHVYFLG